MKQLMLYLKFLIKKLIQTYLNINKAFCIKTERLKRKNTENWQCFNLKEGASLVTEGIFFLNIFLKDLWQKRQCTSHKFRSGNEVEGILNTGSRTGTEKSRNWISSTKLSEFIPEALSVFVHEPKVSLKKKPKTIISIRKFWKHEPSVTVTYTCAQNHRKTQMTVQRCHLSPSLLAVKSET